jgi:hypothetical protein
MDVGKPKYVRVKWSFIDETIDYWPSISKAWNYRIEHLHNFFKHSQKPITKFLTSGEALRFLA